VYLIPGDLRVLTEQGLLLLLSQWDSYIKGWELLINNGDQFFWNLLVLTAFIVRGLSLISVIYYCGLRLFWDRQGATKGIFVSLLVFVLVTLPFAFAGIPIFWPALVPLGGLSLTG
jgi:hypothetical protein